MQENMEDREDRKYKANMTHEMVLDMLAHLVRIPNLFSVYRPHIKLEYFHIEDPVYVLAEIPLLYIWKGLLLYYDSQDTLDAPTKKLLEHYIVQALANDLNSDPDLKQALFDGDENSSYVEYIFSEQCDSFNPITGKELLKQFLVERGIASRISRMAQEMTMDPTNTDMNISQRIDALAAEAQHINTLGVTAESVQAFPDDDYYANVQAEVPVPTGMPWLDDCLGGGQLRKSANAVIGCTGCGKTTFALQLITMNSLRNRAEVLEGGDPELCIYYSFEQNSDAAIVNIQSVGANIGIDSLFPVRNLSTCEADLKPYEKILWPDAVSRVPELTRWNENKRWFNSSIIVQNFSGVPDRLDATQEQKTIRRELGKGGIDEIASDVERLVKLHKKNVRLIVIDYAGLVCYRQLGINSDDKKFYNALAYMGDDCRKKLAGRFNCVVWLLHQIAGASNGKSPLIPVTHSDAAGCKVIGDNMDNCMCLGNPDKGSVENHTGKCLYANFSKTRHTGAGTTELLRILQHDYYIRMLRDVTETYVPDYANKKFVSRQELTYG